MPRSDAQKLTGVREPTLAVPAHTPDPELQRLAEAGPEPARTLAGEVLHVRGQVAQISGLLGVYNHRTVTEAWRISREVLGD